MNHQLLTSIDTSTFEDTLYNEAKITFPKMIAEYKAEKIYMLGFYHSGCYSYIFPIALTEADLVERPDLRWWECDAKHHCEYEDGTSQANELLNDFSEVIIYGDDFEDMEEDEIDDWDEEEDEKKVEAYYHFVEQAVANVFARLENDGVFNELGDRNHYILNLVCGDQSWEDKLNYAQGVNPESALIQLTSDVTSRKIANDAKLAKFMQEHPKLAKSMQEVESIQE